MTSDNLDPVPDWPGSPSWTHTGPLTVGQGDPEPDYLDGWIRGFTEARAAIDDTAPSAMLGAVMLLVALFAGVALGLAAGRLM